MSTDTLSRKYRLRSDNETAPPATEADGLEFLMAEIARPLIGTEAFSNRVMAECANAAREALSGIAARRYQRLARGVGRMVVDPFGPHTVADLAMAAGMSRSAFADCFTATFDRSPLDFLKAERLRYALHLLCTTSLPVKTIYGQIGYVGGSYFARAFRDAFGMTPGEARSLAYRNGLHSGIGSGDHQRALQMPAWGRERHHETVAAVRFELICKATQDVLWDIDLSTGRVWWSEGMLPVFGYGDEQIGPDTAWCHEHIHPDDRERVTEGMQKACASDGTLWRDEFRYRKADGSYAVVADRGVIVRDAAGKALRFMGTMQDITNYRSASTESS